jgi:hypothetical protein
MSMSRAERARAQALWAKRQTGSLTSAEQAEYDQLKVKAYREMRHGS